MRAVRSLCRWPAPLVFLFGLAFASPERPAIAKSYDAVPDVHFVVIRSDFLTYEIKGYYEFSHPMRKSLPEPEFVQIGNVFARDLDWVDSGEREINSRLTGEQLVGVSWMWDGAGGFWFPPDSLLSTAFETGFTNPEPDTLIFGWDYDPYYPVDPATAWDRVWHTDIIQRLSSLGNYEVLYFCYFYTYGVADPHTAEWIFVAYTHPPAPDDMAFTAVIWPKRLVTKGADVAPEITAHNFSDGPADVSVRFTLSSPSGPIVGLTQPLGVIPADESRTVCFTPVTVEDDASLTFGFVFETPSGDPWLDAYPENDVWEEHVSVTHQPTFRRVYHVRPDGVTVDFDDDGDADIVQWGDFIKLWQNDGTGNFTDITALSPVTLRPDPVIILGEDFDGDESTDILLIHKSQPAQLLAGNSTGIFTEAPADPALASIAGYDRSAMLDKENDGDIDLVFQLYNLGQKVLENDGAAHFSDVTSESGIAGLQKATSLRTADFDNDGDIDIIASIWGAKPSLFANHGDGTFSLAANDWETMYCQSCMVFDYNRDGLQDVFFSRSMGGSWLYQNVGSLHFYAVLPVFPTSSHAASADFNGDGFPDLLLDEAKLLVNFNAVFVDSSALMIDAPHWLGPVSFVDLDGDSALDIYAGRGVFINQADIDDTDPVFITLFSAHTADRGVELTWDVVADEAVEGFYIYRSQGDESSYNVLNSGRPIPPDSRSFTDTDVVRPGIYKYRLGVVCSNGEETVSQELTVETGGFALSLHQNYPNPFNPATTIAFSLPQKTRVNLSIYTADGKLVTTLVDETLDGGPKKITWDGKDAKGNAVSSGVYFCRLNAGNHLLTKKMVVLR